MSYRKKKVMSRVKQFFDAIIVASSDKEWFQRPIKI